MDEMKNSIFFINIFNCDEVKGNLQKMFALMKKLNVSGLQMSYDEVKSFDTAEYKKALDCNGVKLVCTHITPRLLSKDELVVKSAIDECVQALKTVSPLGCEYLMVVPFHPDDVDGMQDKTRARETFAQALKIIVDEAKKYSVKIVIENISQLILPFSSVEDIEYLIDAVPGLCFCFDTGNVVCIGEDAEKAYEKICGIISMVHIKDFGLCTSDGYGCDSGRMVKHVPFGEGEAKLREILRKHSKVKPATSYIIEIHSEAPREGLVEQACKFAEEVLGEN